MAAYLPACGSDPICPTDAHEELVQECENIWKQMEKCHLMLLNLETETPLESNEEISLLTVQMKALTAEYNQWQKKSPELISTNPDVLLTLGKKELQKVKNDLLMVMSTVQSKNKQLEEDLKREQQWHEEQEQVLHVLNKLEEETKTQAKQLYKPSLNTMELNEVKKEVLKLKTYKQELLKALYEFLEEHFPLPEKGTRATKKLDSRLRKHNSIHHFSEASV
ncbi:centromere protein K isoform 2-T2 [Podargus strigoides]